MFEAWCLYAFAYQLPSTIKKKMHPLKTIHLFKCNFCIWPEKCGETSWKCTSVRNSRSNRKERTRKSWRPLPRSSGGRRRGWGTCRRTRRCKLHPGRPGGGSGSSARARNPSWWTFFGPDLEHLFVESSCIYFKGIEKLIKKTF